MSTLGARASSALTDFSHQMAGEINFHDIFRDAADASAPWHALLWSQLDNLELREMNFKRFSFDKKLNRFMKNPRRGGNRRRGQIRSNLLVELPSHDGSVEGSFGRRRPSRGHPSATTWGGVRCIDRSTGRSGSPAPWAPLCCFGLLPKANDILAPCLSPRRVLWAHAVPIGLGDVSLRVPEAAASS